jgi:hypothetical protein
MRCYRSLLRHGCGCRCLNGDLFFACDWSRGRLNNHAGWGWCHNNNRTRGSNPCGGLGDNRPYGRTRGNGWGGGRRSDNGRR